MAVEPAKTRFGPQPLVYGDLAVERVRDGGLPHQLNHPSRAASCCPA